MVASVTSVKGGAKDRVVKRIYHLMKGRGGEIEKDFEAVVFIR